MKDIIKHFVIGLVIGLIASGLMVWGYNVGKRHSTNTVEAITDTITVTDTIANWQYDTVYFNHYDTLKLPVVDTINDTVLKIDSILVQIPISTTIYDTAITDTSYKTHLKAVVSGFSVAVDSVYLSTEITPQRVKKQPWYTNLCPAVGIGFGTGWQIGLFAGIGYKL